MNHKVAIAISTRNREEPYFKCLQEHLLRVIGEHHIFVVDDQSEPKYCTSDHRFNERSGISAVKNKCLKLCYESGADHIFLFDDDTYPISENWWLPYIESELEHAMYCFGHGRNAGKYKCHHTPNGCMLYFTRKCIDTIGGFDTNYPNKYEHTDLSRRIYNAGLTPAPYIDVIGSDKLIYCMDQDNATQRSFTQKEMNDNLKSGYDYFMSQANSKEFKEFRT
jgi:glycosyltransferase involved in cell wall biosynthesis